MRSPLAHHCSLTLGSRRRPVLTWASISAYPFLSLAVLYSACYRRVIRTLLMQGCFVPCACVFGLASITWCIYGLIIISLAYFFSMRRALSEPDSSEATTNTLSTKGNYKEAPCSTWMLESLQSSTVNTGKSRKVLPAGHSPG